MRRIHLIPRARLLQIISFGPGTRRTTLPTLTINCSNNYGPYQFPEKLIPHTIIQALAEKEIPIYGDGRNVRDWLYVNDHARALALTLERGVVGETYNIGGRSELTNIDVVRTICDILDHLEPSKNFARLISFVPDRPGHDRRYAIDPSKIERELGWRATETLEAGIEKTVQWYRNHPEWWRSILDRGYELSASGWPSGLANSRHEALFSAHDEASRDSTRFIFMLCAGVEVMPT